MFGFRIGNINSRRIDISGKDGIEKGKKIGERVEVTILGHGYVNVIWGRGCILKILMDIKGEL